MQEAMDTDFQYVENDDFQDEAGINPDEILTLQYKNKNPASTSLISLQDLPLQPSLKPNLRSTRRVVVDSELPPTDYYLYETNNVEQDLFNDYPVARNIVESGTKFFIERNLYAHLHATIEHAYNSFQDEDIELESLAVKPPSFVIFGKSGIGASTLGRKLAEKLKCIHINPTTVVKYFEVHEIPAEAGVVVTELETLVPQSVLNLMHWRIRELDVLHKGYVMDGVPLINSGDGDIEMSIEDQMVIMNKFIIKPQFIILMHMQDIDLFRRRVLQKQNVESGKVYTRAQYINTKLSTENLKESKNRSKSGKQNNEYEDSEHSDDLSSENSDEDNPEPASIIENQEDFEPLTADIIENLISREEDKPSRIQRDFDNFRNHMHQIEKFVESCDRRKVLELNAYFSPGKLLEMVLEFTDSFGITPAPLPVKLVQEIKQPKMIHNLQEEEGEWTDAEGALEEKPCGIVSEKYVAETDWEAVLRACTVQGRVDPRFRWRISRWKNLCPVALKHGRSICGKPELAVGFMDKVYFMSSEEAIELFSFNPRPYLLPTMPASPVKFYVVGHPLAGKSLFASEIAKHCDGYVIDMEREVKKRMHLVKFDYLFRTRLEAVFDITKKLNKEYFRDWKRQERARRIEVYKWIENFIRRKADEVMNNSLKLEADEFKRQRDEFFAAAATHEMKEPYAGACQTDKGDGFTWAEFVKQMHDGKRHWTHQETLELAWDLFHAGKLKYKVTKEEMKARLKRIRPKRHVSGSDLSGDVSESSGLSEDDSEAADEDEDEGLGSSEEEEKSKRKKKRRRRLGCKPVKPANNDNLVEVESKESSVFGPDEETDESIHLRFPEIPPALIFSIPRPAEVTSKHPEVEEYVLIKMVEAEKWAEGSPPELYTECLRRAIKEVENKYLEKNFRGPLSGGWVVENLEPDIAKWRECLRNPVTAPDNIIGLLDYSPGNTNIFSRLKEHFRAELHSRQLTAFLREAGEAADLHRAGAEFIGEDAGEGGDLLEFLFGKQGKSKSSTEILMNMLPKDDLTETFKTETSQVSAHKRDHDRQISMADSVLDITADPKKLMEEWLKTFDSKNPTPISEISSGRSPYSQPKPEMEVWIARHVNYEMLTDIANVSEVVRSTEEEHLSPHFNTRSEYIEDDQVEILTDTETDEKTTATSDVRPKVNYDNRHQKLAVGRPSFLEIGGEESSAATPKGLLSEPDILCGEDILQILGPEDLGVLSHPCVEKIHTESPKRRFFRLVTQFDEFWNMAIPVIHEQQIRYWEMGVIDEDRIRDKINLIWDDLESRFLLPPKKVDERELKEETEEWEEANKMWGISMENQKEKEYLGEMDGEDEDETDEDEESDAEIVLGLPDPFAKLENKPDEYLKSVSRVNEMRLYGDLKDYCPVTYKKTGVMRKGSPKFAAKFRDKLYLMANEDYLQRFLDDPMLFLPINKPLVVPAARICITGSPGCRQEEVAIRMAEQHQIYYINFRQRLQELVRVKLGKKIGPDAFDFGMREESLLGLKESNSSFELPTVSLLDGSKTSIHENEYEGEDGVWTQELRQREMDLLPLQKLGVTQTANLAMCPMSNIRRTEQIAGRDWLKLNKTENAIKDFLEIGAQLPEFVLDEYIAPLWLEDPFKCKGFILVGFPNTALDMKYLEERNFIPEFVYVIDCNLKALKNRLRNKTVDEWHQKYPHPNKRGQLERTKAKPEINEFRNNQEIVDSWTYRDDVALRISSQLNKYHHLYSSNLKNLKIAMNQFRINWMPIHADISLRMAELELIERISSSLKYRSSMFESTYELSHQEATVLINRGFYRLSKFGRWCPVEIMKGNVAINLWNAPGVKKIPILYRGYIYFTNGDQNAKQFHENVWEVVNSSGNPQETMPLFVCILGPPKSGKTSLAAKLANDLGLIHIKQEEVLQDVLKHSFVNTAVKDYEMSPNSLNAGPQPMKMADEILAYLRGGYKVPQYMYYRALDLALLAPRAQFHGCVFDDYPLEDGQLQELLERGIIPTLVINLKMDLAEAYRRAEAKRFDPLYDYEDFTEECENFIDYLNEDYLPLISASLKWYADELKCLLTIDATQSPSTIFKTVKARCIYVMNNMHRYINCGLTGKPVVLEGTGPITSLLEVRLSDVFKNYDPVALNETNELVKIENIQQLSLKCVVEYKGEIYVFQNEKNVQMFVNHPERYTPPGCKRVPPPVLPTAYNLSEEEMMMVDEHWGFQDFDPVFYHEGNFQYKWLKRGQPKYCCEYKNKLFFFMNAENLEKFSRQPQLYWNIPLPPKLPAKASPKPLDALSPSGFLIASGLSQEVINILTVMAARRPRFPFMSLAKSGVLYMGYYLKSLNMKTSSELRTHYRKSMTHMQNTQTNAEKIAKELETLHGKKTIPHDVKKRIQLFLNLAVKPDKERVVDPFIPDLSFSYDAATDPEVAILKNILKTIREEQRAKAKLKVEEEGEDKEEDRPLVLPQSPKSEVLVPENYTLPPYLDKEQIF